MPSGDRSADAFVWFPGETSGTNIEGETIVIPSGDLTVDVTTLDTRVDTLSARLVASGVLPVGV